MALSVSRNRSVLMALVVAGAVFTAIAHAQQAPPGPAAPATGNGMIAGRVVDADSGQGIAGATVSLNLARPGGAAVGLIAARYTPVIADSRGRFVFTNLPAGTFTSGVERDGYFQAFIQRTIDIAAGAQVTDFDFRLNKFNTVLGTVRDDVGDAVVGTDVVAFIRTASQGRPPALSFRGRGRTDDRGEYRLNGLPAGQYLICACTRDSIPFDGQLLTTLAARPLDLLSVARRAAVAGADVASLDSTLRTYAPTFYPNSTLVSRAERVRLEKGETRNAVDISVASVRAVRVSGQIIGLPPSSISAGSMRLTAVGDVPEAVAITQLPPMLVQPDGRFDFGGVPPGTYILDVNTVVGMGSGGPTGGALAFLGARGGPPPPPPPPTRGGGPAAPQELLWASETIVVGAEDVTGVVVAIQRGIHVRGKIEFVGASAPPQANAMRGIVQLAATEVWAMRPSSFIAQINPDGTFAFIVPPGRYVIPEPPTFPPAWANARSITAKGVDISDAPLTVDGDVPDLTITMTDAPAGSLLGTAELMPGDVPEEMSVLIFPADRRFWKEPIGAIRRFRAVRLTSQRTFTVPRIPPGDYLLVLTRVAPLDWMEAPALEELSKGATSVSVTEGDKKTVQVKR